MMVNNPEDSNKWSALLVVIFGLFLVSLDMNIVNLAISKMMQNFNASLDQIQWVLSGYSLTLGIIMPVTGYLADRFGTKKVFIVSMVIFTGGSLLCGIAWNTAAIIVFRIVQGLGGGLIIPISMTILMSMFEGKERGTALAILGIANMVAPALGPTLGGYILEHFDWRLVFLINIPVGVVGTALSFILLGKAEPKPAKRFDLLGLLTSSAGLGCVLYILGKENIDWGDLTNVILMIIGCYSLLMFVVNELMVPEPMLDLRLLKNYTFCMCNIILNIAILALFGGIFLVPIFLQQIKGLTPMQTGMILFPEAISTAIAMVIASKLSVKFGAKKFAVIALAFLALNGYNMSHITLDTSNDTITLLLMLRGLAVGLLMIPVQLAGFNAVSKEDMANASALLNTVKQIGMSIGITIITSIMQHRNNFFYAGLAGQVSAFNLGSLNLFKMLKSLLFYNGASLIEAQNGALSLIYGAVAKEARMLAINDTMLVISGIALITILPTFLLKEHKQPDSGK
jgi:EmrB/QacA subfamily drug resistance transporter